MRDRTTLDDIRFRVIDMANYIILHHGTIRMAAAAYCIAKSTAHKQIHRYLPDLDPQSYDQVITIFNENFAMKHIHGGEATARRFAEMRREKHGS